MSPPNSGGILTLTLTPDNPSNTTITNPAGDILYTAKILFPRGKDSSYATTQFAIAKAKQSLCLNLRMTLPFLLRMRRKYKWKDYDAEDTIETLDLHASDDSSDLIAQFRPSHARPDTSRRPAQLLLAPRAQEMMDIVVTSFLFLEKRGGRLRTQVVHRGGV
ncbi:hypothetical protein ACEPAG_71 [Sanghuangporus baumii]